MAEQSGGGEDGGEEGGEDGVLTVDMDGSGEDGSGDDIARREEILWLSDHLRLDTVDGW